jgi:hypothetical protein
VNLTTQTERMPNLWAILGQIKIYGHFFYDEYRGLL